MATILRAADFELRPGGTVRFEGAPHESQSSFFHVRAAPGMGSALHKHPYPETWIVRSGTVRFTVGGAEIQAGAGDIVVADPDVPHRFLNIGADQLEIICIHPSPRIIQEAVVE